MARPSIPTARDIMTPSLVTLSPEMKALEAAQILVHREISGAPVVDEQGHLVGLLSEYDCLRAVAAAEYEADAQDTIQTVGDLMTRECQTVGPGIDLFGLAHEFLRLRVRRFPVLEDGQLIGQVSRRDALRAALALREALGNNRHYPDYPQGREPIRDYPQRRR